MARDFAIRNPDKLLENMVLMRDMLAEKGVRCFLHYGTLLGAVREHGFIPHDDDADLGVFSADTDAILTMIPALYDAGFSFLSQREGRLLQFVRDGEQVDLFVAVPKWSIAGKRWWIDERVSIHGRHLDQLDTISFLGHDFLIPTNPEGLMRFLYGKTWKIPMANIPSKTGFFWKIQKVLRNPGKMFFYVSRFFRMKKIKDARTHS